jgi:hypothetical protein
MFKNRNRPGKQGKLSMNRNGLEEPKVINNYGAGGKDNVDYK